MMKIVTGKTGQDHITALQDKVRNATLLGNGRIVVDMYENLRGELVSNNLVRINSGVIFDQGTQIMIEENDYEEVTIDNGETGYNRIDRIVMRYTRNEVTGIESVELVVKKGTPTSSGGGTGAEIEESDILGGGTLDEMLLYEVKLTGLSAELSELKYTPKKYNAENITKIERGGTGASDAAGARANLGLGAVAIENVLPISKGGTNAADSTTARKNLGIGAVATEDVLPISKGGTGATTSSNALVNLGVADYVVQTGLVTPVKYSDLSTAEWEYRLWNSGVIEAWANNQLSAKIAAINTPSGGGHFYSDPFEMSLPPLFLPDSKVIATTTPTTYTLANIEIASNSVVEQTTSGGNLLQYITIRTIKPNSNLSNIGFIVSVKGRWK